MADPMSGPLITYDEATDTLLVQLRPWPAVSPEDGASLVGGEDAGEGLVIHYGPDGAPFAWEIESASRHPDLVTAVLKARRSIALDGKPYSPGLAQTGTSA